MTERRPLVLDTGRIKELPAGDTLPGSGAATAVNQTAHGFAVGDVLYFNGTIFALADADSAVTAEVVGIVKTVTDADNFILHTGGWLDGLSGLTAGVVYFLSATAGDLTATEPSTPGQISKPLLIADTTTSGYFFNFRGMVITSGALDHGTLGGLTDDDHPQYILKSLVDAKGDLIVGTADNVVDNLTVGTNGLVLVADSAETTGVKWAVAPHGTQAFTASGSWVCPAGITTAWLSGAGAGGGGGGSSTTNNAGGAGGGAGAVAIKYQVTVVPGTTYTVTIATGGAAGTTGSGGNGSGATTFGALLSLAAGSGGGGASSFTGGGGGGGAGTGSIAGAVGGYILVSAAGDPIIAGDGGTTPWGYPGRGARHIHGNGTAGQPGVNGVNGSGGGGAAVGSATGANGGAGGNGILIVEW